MGTKKNLMLLVAFVVALVCVNAYWLGFLRTSAVYTIFSADPIEKITFTANLTDGFLNCTNTSAVCSLIDFAELNNSGNSKAVNISIAEVKTDVIDSCSNWTNDCSVAYRISNPDRSITNGIVTNITNGTSSLSVNITCVKFACPQSIGTMITLTPQ